MINLNNSEKIMLLTVAKKLNSAELERLQRIYIDTDISIDETRVVQLYHEELEHIIEIAKSINADFELSLIEQKRLNDLLPSPVEILWEGVVSKTRPNPRCLLVKKVPDMHRYINKLLSMYDGRTKYLKDIAFIYNYLVESGLEEKSVNIKNIKEQLLQKKKETPLQNSHNQPREMEKSFSQDVPF